MTGSPAWAGIDPFQSSVEAKALRFPRVGGDRPHNRAGLSLMAEVPPRGRG